MTTFIALSRVGIDSTTGAQNTGIPSLLIALPAFTAILVGHWSDNSRLPSSSVSAYFGLLGTMFISLASTLIFLLDAAGQLRGTAVQLDFCCGGGTVSTNWPWLGLAMFACSQTVYLWLRLHQGTGYYRRLQKSAVGVKTEQVWAPSESATASVGSSPGLLHTKRGRRETASRNRPVSAPISAPRPRTRRRWKDGTSPR
jgi:hypothetical protein